MSFVGDVGERGDLEYLSDEEDEDGDLDNTSDGEYDGVIGEEGEGEKIDSSLGVRSILIIGGTPSTDFDLLPAFGEGDLDLLTLLEPKLEL